MDYRGEEALTKIAKHIRIALFKGISMIYMFKNGIDSYCKLVASEHRKKPFAQARLKKVIEQKGNEKQF